jgi:hypothetical protein
MIFTAEENGHTYRYSIWDGKAEYSCADLPAGKQTYDSLDALHNAVRRYDLSLKKQFRNKTAYYVGHNERLIEVTVTSLDEKKEAWIVSKLTGRQKVTRECLFANRAELEKLISDEQESQERFRGRWSRLDRWEPKP